MRKAGKRLRAGMTTALHPEPGQGQAVTLAAPWLQTKYTSHQGSAEQCITARTSDEARNLHMSQQGRIPHTTAPLRSSTCCATLWTALQPG
jgi:hypothetical protein